MRRVVRCLPSVCLLVLPLLSCTGVLDGSRNNGATPGSGGGSGGSNVGGAAGAASQPATDCGKPAAPVLHARLLTPTQYENTVQDLLKVADHPAKDFGGGLADKLDELAVERRANAAAAIASSAVASLSAWSPCVPPAVDAVTCGAQLVDKLGMAAFRHPLSTSERAQLQTLFDAGVAEKDFATGVDWLLTGLLQTPDFLYQFAKPKSGEVAGQIVPLGDYELASRLALFVWDSSPDDALYAAAASGKLADAAQLDTELTRMLADSRFGRGTSSFYFNWLGLKGFKEVARDDPGLTSDVVDALESSLLMSATALYASGSPKIESLFNGQSYYLNDKLRTFYGLAGGGPDFAPAELPAAEGRRGILTHPALLTLLSRPKESNPIARGLFVQRTVLCHEIPPPPTGITIPQLPPITPGVATRSRLEQHTLEPLCAGCHDQIDPPGFALEGFDQVGRFRTMDAGVAVNTSGVMSSNSDVDGPFKDGSELLGRIATSADAKRCFAKHYLTFAVSRDLQAQDGCSLSQVAESFAQTGDLKQLIVAVAKTDAFRLRQSEDAGAMP